MGTHNIWFYGEIRNIPANTRRSNNVESTLIQRQDVESTLNRRCFNVVCPLGYLSGHSCYLELYSDFIKSVKCRFKFVFFYTSRSFSNSVSLLRGDLWNATVFLGSFYRTIFGDKLHSSMGCLPNIQR